MSPRLRAALRRRLTSTSGSVAARLAGGAGLNAIEPGAASLAIRAGLTAESQPIVTPLTTTAAIDDSAAGRSHQGRLFTGSTFFSRVFSINR